MKKEIKSQSFWHLICQNWSSIDNSMAPQRWKVPISIVAVNHIKAIDHIDWFHSELPISMAWVWTAYLLMLISNVIMFFYSLIWFTNVRKWAGDYFTPTNVQFEKVNFFIKVSMKKSSCSFNMVKLTVNQRCCIIGMLDAIMWIHDNVDPNWAIEVCKWSVTITNCSFPYIGKSKELDYVRKSAHGVVSGSNHPP